MARYKDYDYNQRKLIPVSFDEQILPGSFEYTLSYLIEHEFDLSVFESRYENEETGAPAYDPAILLKIILYAYSRGIVSSRAIERACRENVVFMALSCDTQPHFTTIAGFVSSCGEEIVSLFRDVVWVCDELGLIGREMFAIDGCKLPSNASKQWSGTKAELTKRRKKLERAMRFLLGRHREADKRHDGDSDGSRGQREKRQIETLRQKVRKLKQFTASHEDKKGRSGKVTKSNVTDNDSAKMATSHGVIQGYTGVAAVDAKHQVVVHAQAYGEGQEHGLLQPTVAGIEADLDERALSSAKLTADSGFHTEKNAKYLIERGIDGYLADNGFRKRDPRFATAARYKTRHRKEKKVQRMKAGGTFTPADFVYDAVEQRCTCPAGKRLYRNGANVVIRGYQGVKFRGAKRDCVPCERRAQCMKNPSPTATRQVVFFTGPAPSKPETYTDKMKRKLDSDEGRYQYGRRLGIVEPVFANLRSTLGLNRFTLRGKHKVNSQWLLYCMVHNIGKIHRYGEGFT